ncbi:MAG: hypothetical protein Q8930_06975 [Bacillota bacterium]|nr:hypothetical protein [Bacillota bacterium]
MDFRLGMRRKYSHFFDLTGAAAARELGMMVLSAEYTRAFSLRLRNILEELDDKERDLASISVMFNMEGDIAIIDEALVGSFVALRYKSVMEEYYKGTPLNKIARSVMEGGEKRILDFLDISYDVLYDTLQELYKEIVCKKEVLNTFKMRYNISSYNKEDSAVVAIVLMILEDMVNYMGIKESYILTLSALKTRKIFSQHI